MVAIDLQNVGKRFRGAGRGVQALDAISLSVEAGEWLAVMGPSGSGKTTLVQLIGGLERPTSGSVWVAGADLGSLGARELARFRAETVGFVFQQFHLVPYLTALENVMLAQYFHSLADPREARGALAAVGLEDRAAHLPGQLSGGEQQRVVLARALINDPAILLADEPTGNLDEDNEVRVLDLLGRAHAAGKTIVMVTHDPTVARLADRRVQLHHGRITEVRWLAAEPDEQWDEILERLWILRENHEPTTSENIRAWGPMPLTTALEELRQAGLVAPNGAGWRLSGAGERRASDIVRRHRLAELLFSGTLELHDEAQLQAQACKFEHILSPEATARICSFLGHPRFCPHGSPIPRGECCPRTRAAIPEPRAAN